MIIILISFLYKILLPFILEAGATDKFTHDGCWWNFLVTHRQEEMNEFQQSMCFGVFRAVFRNGGKDDFGMGAKYGKFDVEGRVEHHIR